MRFLSPVFGKEMVTLARRKRHYFSRALFLSVLLAVIAMSWLAGMSMLRYQGFMDTASLGRDLYIVFTITQLLAVAVLVPAMTAPIIAEEKDKNTLALLLMSNLKIYNILLDKLLSRITLMVLLLFSSLPLFLVLLAFGGITPGQIFGSYILIVATILMCSALGLFFSTLLNKMYTAMIATYAVMAGYFFGMVLLDETGILPFKIGYLIPVDVLTVSYSQHIFLVGFSILIFVISLLTCKRLLPRMIAPKKQHVLKRISQWMNNFFEKINFTGVVVMNENRAIQHNAIMWKETHKHFFSSTTFLVRSSYALLMLSMILLSLISSWEGLIEIVLLIGVILLALIAIIASSVAFTLEREKHSFEMLMSTPLTARHIVMAKFIGVLKLTIPVLVFMVIWLGVGSFVGNYYCGYRGGLGFVASEFELFFIMVSLLPMLVVMGLYSSVKRHRMGSAILQTFLMILALYGISFILEVLDGLDMFYSFNGARWRMTHISSFFMLKRTDFSSPWTYSSIPCWIILLNILIHRFDKIIGRQ